MGTLSSELAPHAERLSPVPRVYADANVPAGLVAYMRASLGWDVLFVLEADDLRRAADLTHYRLACQLRRTLVTLDRDYLDDRRFPPAETGGVLVLSAPTHRQLEALLRRLHHALFRAAPAGASGTAAAPGEGTDGWDPLPLNARKLHAHTDWGRGRS